MVKHLPYLKLTASLHLLMAEILHQLVGSLSHYLQGFIHPWWCRISAINSSTFKFPPLEATNHLNPPWLPSQILPLLGCPHTTWEMQQTDAGGWPLQVSRHRPPPQKKITAWKTEEESGNQPKKSECPPKKIFSGYFSKKDLWKFHVNLFLKPKGWNRVFGLLLKNYPVIFSILGFQIAPHLVGKYTSSLATLIAPAISQGCISWRDGWIYPNFSERVSCTSPILPYIKKNYGWCQ